MSNGHSIFAENSGEKSRDYVDVTVFEKLRFLKCLHPH